MRYSVVDKYSIAIDDLGFNSKSDAETWIQSEIKIRGLNMRAGSLVLFRDGTQIEIVKSKTGERVDWFNVVSRI